MPQSPNHPKYQHALPRRHGDMVRPDGGSAANDLITMGTHVGTHIDALAHVSHCGRLYGNVDANEAQVGGRFDTHGVDAIPPIVSRGLLLDIPRVLGLDVCSPGYEVTPDDLSAALELVGRMPNEGDVLLIRSGWGRLWDKPEQFVGAVSGVPGVGEAGAQWLAAWRPAAVGADTIAFERIAPGEGHSVLPAHRVLLVEAGINIMETLVLDELAASNTLEFLFVASPLHLVGATGAPIRPLAIIVGD
jgi:kynurenine formamidase